MKQTTKLILLALLVLTPTMGTTIRTFAQTSRSEPSSQYYPLAKGNVWEYEVHSGSSKKVSKVEWTVTSANESRGGTVYQVWPRPSQSDDDAMMLRVSSSGIEETSSAVLILKENIVTGDKWTSGKWDPRNFHVISTAQPCSVGSVSSERCIVIDDYDATTHLRTVTTYAKGIGPILYQYFGKNSRPGVPTQTVELVSYHLAKP